MRIPATRLFALLPILLLLSGQSRWEHTPVMASCLFAAGVFLIGIGALGRLLCSLYIAGRKDHSLVVQGPYSLSRNPLYFFSLLGATGVGFATETFTIPLLVAGAFLIYYPGVIRREEDRLLRLFPAEFPSYLARVPRFFPRTLAFAESEQYMVNPRIFRRHIGSALWFVWILGLLEAVEVFHEAGILPSCFSLY